MTQTATEVVVTDDIEAQRVLNAKKRVLELFESPERMASELEASLLAVTRLAERLLNAERELAAVKVSKLSTEGKRQKRAMVVAAARLVAREHEDEKDLFDSIAQLRETLRMLDIDPAEELREHERRTGGAT